jgi:hypothetical protein
MGENLNFLPPALYPCGPVDGADQRFLDLNYDPIVEPLKSHLDIEGYNLHWFDPGNAPTSTAPTLASF